MLMNDKQRIFNYDKITLTKNADKLFRNFLMAIENEYGKEFPKLFTIAFVVSKIPKNNVGINNDSSYNYAINALFGSQKDRKYFAFYEENLQKQFTETANDTHRNNLFWAKHKDSLVSINPEFIMQNGEH